ncbi:GH116 family glycosyl hydrolase [Conexibacter stalactiti]|uniref:GH116 family glycosyl hydrolase n=1 Tax=Conexibacter stalactiti TaxID=1940611 RepID=A0ABU4HXK9_9ACTN|nr:GH116 family glycosyl hydrolase [Conexibacter stalactiti]MDW5597960.1 GH116 family glycosyl hydrolase [Conexibacter stalactiti]MEC5038602.1 GH116 family glycosyl hydrolase [Conexibacter stalactiti]
MSAPAGRPTVRRHSGDDRRAVALPLGGVGAGHVALGGDGVLRQWQLHNLPNHAGELPQALFALRASSVEPPLDVRRVLHTAPLPAPAQPAPNVDDHLPAARVDGSTAGWPSVAATTFESAYPFARVRFEDAELPVTVELESHTPFVPLDEEASGLPLVVHELTLSNVTELTIHGFALATLPNAVGWDGITPLHDERCGLLGGNVNRLIRGSEATTVLMDNPLLAEDDPGYGQMALWSDHACVPLPRAARALDALRFLDTLKLLGPTQTGDWSEAAVRAAVADSTTPQRVPTGPSPAGTTWTGALAIPFALTPGATTTVRVVHAWWFPNRTVDFDQFGPERNLGPSRLWVGNWYGTRFPGGVADVLDEFAAHGDALVAASRTWAHAVADADLPEIVVDVLDAQPSLVRSPTTLRTADGNLFGFEGGLGVSTLNWNGLAGGSCPLTCTHVWNYEQALARIFPALERTMRDVELDVTQAPEGYLPHRVVLPLWMPQLHGVGIGGPERPALDGMLGAPLKAYRELRQGAGLDWLRSRWARLQRLMTYVIETWDPRETGVLRGDQPVTHDISLQGPNMFVGGLWLAALRAMEELTRALGESESDAAAWRARFERASARYDELLWNGEYYTQRSEGEAFDFGDGCLADQLLGQWWAHQLELGHLLPVEHVRTALRSIIANNLRDRLGELEHGYRYFADADDSGLLNCTWPKGGRPEVPIRYCDEVWTGVEYQVAAHCLMEGLEEEGLRLLRALRARYDGSRRNPYNEIECGDHYARAMAGWSVLEALTGYRYDALGARVAVSGRTGSFPFLAGSAWGTLTVRDNAVEFATAWGEAPLGSVEVDGATFALPAGTTLRAGESVVVRR